MASRGIFELHPLPKCAVKSASTRIVPPNCVGVPENETPKRLPEAEVTGADIAKPGAPPDEKLPAPLPPLNFV
jgi:hypothetical protein